MAQISVLIPVYNAQSYLAECLDSLLAQDFQDWEAICVNDGSTDDSTKILTEYANKDNRIKVISQQNQGQACGRNVLLDNASAPWQMFLDSDDKLTPNALSLLYRMAQESNQPVIVPTAFGSIYDATAPATGTYQICQPALAVLLKKPHLYSSACGKLYRADILKDHRFIPHIFFEDWPFITTLFAKIPSFALTRDVIYLYRQTPNSTMRSEFSEDKIDNYMTGIEFVNKALNNTPQEQLGKKRCSIAARMCINKTWRDRNRSELAKHLVQRIDAAHQQGYFLWRYISLKVMIRYLIMKYLQK